MEPQKLSAFKSFLKPYRVEALNKREAETVEAVKRRKQAAK